MNPPIATLLLKSEFDAFLFAQIGADGSGLPLSVVSVLARLDLDPWHEAALLASLCPNAATQKLISILGISHDAAISASDIPSIAARLVAILPRSTASLPRSPLGSSVSAGAALARFPANWRSLAVYLIVVIAAQLLMTHFMPTPGNYRLASSSSSAPAQTATAPSVR
jgi:hypothetical protein